MLLIGPKLKPVPFKEPIAHGVLKSPCMAVWMLPKKWNSTTSPTAAVMVSGLKTRPPLPTVTVIVVANVLATRVERSAIDKCMLVFDTV